MGDASPPRSDAPPSEAEEVAQLRAELEDLRRRARLKRDILSQVHDAVIAVDLDASIIFINEAALERFEVERSEAMGRPLAEVVRIRYRDGASREGAAAAVDGSGEWRGEVEYETRSGRVFILDAQISALLDESGVRHGSLGVLRDITARRDAERLAREHQQYLEAALSHVPLVATVVDTDLRYRWIYNAPGEYQQRAAIGRTTAEVFGDAEGRALIELRRRALQEGIPVRGEITVPQDGEAHVYDMTVTPLRDAGGTITGVATAALDITERKRHEEELRAAKARAEAANASKSAFLTAMSHELRTPLNAIMGYVDLMDAGVPVPLPPEHVEQARRIKVSSRHLLQLIEEVLEYARADAGQETIEWSDVSVDELAEEAVAILEPLALRKNLELRIDVGGAPDSIRSDARKLRQILLNLMGNAIKFTDAGSVSLGVRQTEGGVVLAVEDTGPGIGEADLPHVFTAFWQAHREGAVKVPGTGLGLAISRQYVHLLGGTLTVASTEGEGSTFTVTLPWPEATAPGRAEPGAPDPAAGP